MMLFSDAVGVAKRGPEFDVELSRWLRARARLRVMARRWRSLALRGRAWRAALRIPVLEPVFSAGP
jgi:hypothetical protein